MADLETIRSLTIKFAQEGESGVVAALGRVESALDKVSSSAESSGDALDKNDKKYTSASMAADRLQKSTDGAYRANSKFEKGLVTVANAVATAGKGEDWAAQQVAMLIHQRDLAIVRASQQIESERAIIAAASDAGKAAAAEAAEIARLTKAASELKWQIDPLAAAQDQLNDRLATYQSMADRGIINTDQLSAANARATAQFEQMAAQVAATGRQGQIATGQMLNMQYQLNDIAVSLASGQSPFTVLMQQGMQLSQGFNPGTSLKKAGADMAAGLMAFVSSPLNLAVAGFAAATGAATLFFNSAETKTKSLTELTNEYASSIKAMSGEFKNAQVASGDFVGYTENAVSQLIKLQQGSLSKALKKSLSDAFSDGGGVLTSMWESVFGGDSKSLNEYIAKAVNDLNDVKLGIADSASQIASAEKFAGSKSIDEAVSYYEDLNKVINDAVSTGNVTALHEQLLSLADNAPNEAIKKIIDRVIELTGDAKKASDELNGLASALHNAAIQAEKDAQRSFDMSHLTGFAKGIADIGAKYDEMIVQAQRAYEAQKKVGNFTGATTSLGDVASLEHAKALATQELMATRTKDATDALKDQQRALDNIGRSDYAAKIADISAEYEKQKALAKGNAGELDALEKGYKATVAAMDAQALKDANSALESLNNTMANAHLSDYARGLAEIQQQYAILRRDQGGPLIDQQENAATAAYVYANTIKPIEDQERALIGQRKALEAQAGALGKSSVEQQQAAIYQDLMNDRVQKGIPITGTMSARLQELAAAQAQVNVQQEMMGRLSTAIEEMPATQIQRMGEYQSFLADQLARGNINANQARVALQKYQDDMDLGLVDDMTDAFTTLGKTITSGFSSAEDALQQFAGQMASIMWDEYVARPLRDALRNGLTDGSYGAATGGTTSPFGSSGGLSSGVLGSSAANPVFVTMASSFGTTSTSNGAQGAIDTFVGAITTGGEQIGDASKDIASGLLKKFEGFSSSPYWDVNHYRNGYGSDTMTTANGLIVEVTKDMSTTMEDANRDLARRISEEQGQIIGRVGQESWAALTEQAKAAVTSVAYNYGTIPESVAQAIIDGSGEGLANAIEGLAGNNGGINSARRQIEANLVREGDRLSGLGEQVSSVTTSFTDLNGNITTVIKTINGLQNGSTSGQTEQFAAQQKAVEKGAAKGVSSGLADAGSGSNQLGLLNGNVSAQKGLELIGSIGGLANSYYAGQQSGNAVVGGVSGAVSGAASGIAVGTALLGALSGPAGWIAAGIGALLGGGLGILGSNSNSNHDEEQARLANYNSQYASRQQFIAEAGGDAYGTVQSTLDSAFSQMQSLVSTIEQMGDPTGELAMQVTELQEAYGKLGGRLSNEFMAAFEPTLAALSSGQGLSGAFGTARTAIIEAGESLRDFVDDAQTLSDLYGLITSDDVQRAREAAQDYALSLLDPVDSLSTVQTRMEEIKGTAAGLQQVLEDLGMSASEAAAAISSATASALSSLKGDFLDELGAATNTALDKGYINDAADLMDQYAANLADAVSLGLSRYQVDVWFRAQAQAIVNDAGLAGDALTEFISMFPELAGAVTASTDELQSAYDDAQSALESTIDTMQSFADAIADFRDSLTLSDDLSTASPLEQLQAAQDDWQTTLALAMTGDQDALGNLTDVAQAYLDEARDYYSATDDYAAIFNEVTAGLDDAASYSADQVSVAQQQLDTMQAQLIGLVDLNTSTLTVAEAVARVEAILSQMSTTAITEDVVQTVATAAVEAAATTAAATVAASNPNNDAALALMASLGVADTGNAAMNMYLSVLAAQGRRTGGLIGGYEAGGLVGNGLWDIDSVVARYAGGGNIALAGGEYVTRAPAVNDNTLGMLSYINRTGSLPSASSSGASADMSGVVSSIQTGITALHRATIEDGRESRAALLTGLDSVADQISDLRRELRQQAADPRTRKRA